MFLTDGFPYPSKTLAGLLDLAGAVGRGIEVIARITAIPSLGRYPGAPQPVNLRGKADEPGIGQTFDCGWKGWSGKWLSYWATYR